MTIVAKSKSTSGPSGSAHNINHKIITHHKEHNTDHPESLHVQKDFQELHLQNANILWDG